MIPHLIFILFFFALGACIGSFLNVVVWRLPRDESLVSPPSHCPKCQHRLSWRDNIPVFGWIFLRGKCRYCSQPISSRYPIIEAITGLLFVFYYVCFFILQQGPCAPVPPMRPNDLGFLRAVPVVLTLQEHWPIYLLDMFMISGLLAASLIDAELFIIPAAIPMWIAGAGLVVHAIVDQARFPGAIYVSPPAAALAAGAGIGLALSLVLLKFGYLPLSFSAGMPDLEIDKERRAQSPESDAPPPVEYTRAQVRVEMSKEMLFLLPPLILGGVWVLLTARIAPLASMWDQWLTHDWMRGLLGSLLGALVGGFTVWLVRIVFSIVFGREAMGMGDVDLMFGVGAVIGPGGAFVAFFLSPFFGIGLALYKLIFRRGRELALGPFLSMGTAAALLFYCQIAEYFTPGLTVLFGALWQLIGGTGR